MSKKKFKAGLESLFGDTGIDDQLPGIRPLLVEEAAAKESSNKTRNRRPKKRSSKNFTSDLEGLFHNALDKDDYKETVQKSPVASGRDTKVKRRRQHPVIGIDALIVSQSGLTWPASCGLWRDSQVRGKATLTSISASFPNNNAILHRA